MAAPHTTEAASRPRNDAEPQPHSGALTSASATSPTAAARNPAPRMSGRPDTFGSLLSGTTRTARKRRHAHRHVDPEHPAPVDLHQGAADHRSECRPQGAHRGPGAQGFGPNGRRYRGQQQRQRRGHHRPGARCLDDPGRDQRGHPGRQPAQHRAEAEQDQPAREEPPPPDPVGPPAGRHQDRGEHDRVGVEHPGQRAQAGARVIPAVVGERQVDDEQVQAGHEHGQRQHADHGGDPAVFHQPSKGVSPADSP